MCNASVANKACIACKAFNGGITLIARQTLIVFHALDARNGECDCCNEKSEGIQNGFIA